MKYTFSFDINSSSSPAMIARRIKENSLVLEFGTADGVLTKYLKEELNCSVFGIEIDEAFAHAASKYTNMMYVGDIEKYDWIKCYKEYKFDYIIFSDVLEHLHHPSLALQQAMSLLKESGSILVSIPNIAHSSIILSLLHETFEYRDTGLLDKTHLKFFTKSSIDKMFDDLGLSTVYSSGVYIPPQLTEFPHTYKDVPKCISDYIRESRFREVYQFVYEVRKKPVDAPLIDFCPKAFIFISLIDENGNNITEIFDDKCESITPFEYSTKLNEVTKVKAIHILIKNIPDITSVEFVKVNGRTYLDYNTNIELYKENLCENEKGLKLYLPFFEELDISSIDFKLNNGKFTNCESKGKKSFLKRIINSILK